MFGGEIQSSFDSMYPKIRKRDYKLKTRRVKRQFLNRLLVYIRNFQQCGPEWVVGVIVRRVGDVMYKTDVRSKCLMRHTNRICDRLLNSDKEPLSWNLSRGYLIDTASLKRQDQCRRSDDQTPRRQLFPQCLQLEPRSKTYFLE